jgi:hypothetical protein
MVFKHALLFWEKTIFENMVLRITFGSTSYAVENGRYDKQEFCE